MKRSEFDMFTDLGNSKNTIKLKGGQMILLFASKDKTGSNLVYALKRIIVGLAGRRMREGCYATLTAIFQCISRDVLGFYTYEKIVNNVLAIPRSTSRKEKSDLYLGKLLAYSVLLTSNYLDNESKEVKEIVAGRIFAIALTKPHLHHPAFVNLVQLINKYELPFINKALRTHLVDLKHHTLDKLYYLLNLSKYCKNSVIKEAFQCNKANMLQESVLIQVADLLLTHCTDQTSLNHPLFQTLAERILPHVSLLNTFWMKLTDEATMKENRKCKVIIQFLYSLLMQMKKIDDLVDTLFSSRVVLILRDNADKQPHVKKIIARTVELMKTVQPAAKYNLIMKILIESDCITFDKSTGTKLCSHLMDDLDLNMIMELADTFQSVLRDSLERKDKNSWTASEKFVAFIYYHKLILKETVASKKNWLIKQLIFLEDICLLNDTTKNINSELAGLMRTSLYNAFGHLPVNYTTHCEILADLTKNIKSKIQKGHILRFKLTEEDFNEWLELYAWTDKMYTIQLKKTENHKVLLLLAFYLLLNAFRHPKESIFNLKDVVKIFENIDTSAEQDHHWSEILVDIFLNLLSKPLSGHRYLVNTVFKIIINNFTTSAFLQLIEILNPENDLNQKTDKKFEESMEEGEDGVSESDSEDSNSNDDEPEGNLTPEHGESNKFDVPTELNITDLDNASIDLDDADEKEINKLNDFVSNLFKSYKIRTKKRKVTQSELTHFRIRLLDLFEICCKENVQISFSNWLWTIPVIVKLFKFSSRSKAEEPLYNKLGSCMRKMYKMSVKDLQISEEHFEDTLLVLNLLLEEVSKSTSKDYRNNLLIVCKLLAKAAIFLRNDSCDDEEGGQLVDTVTTYLKSFFLSKSNIPHTFFSALIDMKWTGAYHILLVASKFTFELDTKYIRRALGLQIIESFFMNSWYFNENQCLDMLKEFEESFTKLKQVYDLCSDEKLRKQFLIKLKSFLKLLEKKDRLKYFDNNMWNIVKKIDAKSNTDLFSQPSEENPHENQEETDVKTTKKRKKVSKILKKQSKRLRLKSINMDNFQNSFYSLLT